MTTQNLPFSVTVVEIGFERSHYSVRETAGQVTLSVAVLSGSLSDEIVIRINTHDRSAKGMLNEQLYGEIPSTRHYFLTILLFEFSCLATEDYSAGNELLTFSSVSTRHDVVITINDDDINEIIEEFGASISFGGDAHDGILLVPDQATVQITDDDGMQVMKCISLLL